MITYSYVYLITWTKYAYGKITSLRSFQEISLAPIWISTGQTSTLKMLQAYGKQYNTCINLPSLRRLCKLLCRGSSSPHTSSCTHGVMDLVRDLVDHIMHFHQLMALCQRVEDATYVIFFPIILE